jgi:hypothetical protein
MAGQRGRSAGPQIRVSLEIDPRRVGMPPKTCVCPHIVYTSVVGCVVRSNVEAPGVSDDMHAHALTTLTHAYSGLGFL